ncbi:dehydrodolichyl diphosphate synthase complex subunit NUS1 isoform X2 [Solenopsis invicta]|uniref:dehydrodolichyl diphosphate synthase complex subunit NUS1 isoform X2 n=1 Tax=Solenopsis invicta TaxID=13686 RepID=UPI00193D8F9F|nr:dehydrodolichyl diphosphate synthase complex subunit NUS1 isoform X2 [Solenopsis invicta]
MKQTLLILAHLLRRLYFAICNVSIVVYRWFTKFWYRTTEFDVLVRTLAKINNMPEHLMIVLGSVNDESVLDCVRIIRWCITLNIRYISFFDYYGFFNKINLKEEFARKQPDLIEHIIWYPSTKAQLSQNKIIDVNSQGKILTLTQALAEDVSSGNLNPEEITEELITEKLQITEMPDPELALIYGYVHSTHGVLPWHTRTTEFLMLPMYANVSLSVKDFTCLLERYCKCEQRYGE